MFKVNLINSFLYLLVKYFIFFFILAFVGDRFKSIVLVNAETTSEIFKLTLNYILYVAIYAIPLILVFSFPLYYILKIRKGLYFVLSITLLFTVEYLIYTYLYAPSNKILGIYNIIVGIILLGIFFYKSIRIKFTE
ncbi:hypothetical protein CMU11_15420 [Elizabethkingia anophelis]|nr:hypothetical protein [Elizabethkingia anophelis]MDV3477428.1 hypothetical protein [Elizabethkingia anophelis]MDV3610556.1 hypothetical protein [Elizabethkingia anophelis]MDV3677365.1 hypothetical protein [Elizabethkingia anophelis]MDV3684629.1 hypothetical protein [Elizabethkingia anophelis]